MNFESESEELQSGGFIREKTTTMPTTTEIHNPKVRRRNVNTDAVPPTTNNLEESKGTENLVGSWPNGDVPRVPLISEFESDGLPNGELDDDQLEDPEPPREACKVSEAEKEKLAVIDRILRSKDEKEDTLGSLGCSDLGFVNDDARRILWPRLLGMEDRREGDAEEEEEKLDEIHKKVPEEVYQQILKDVVRSGSHLHPNATEEEMEKFQTELTQIMCWVLHRHPSLNYYQGYNDIAATVLIVMGVQRGLRVLERISLDFLERFMERTMEKVNQELFYIFALLHRIHPTLLQHLENVELFPHFALAEYTTWYAHKYAENRKLLHRLFDFFLGSPALMPLYLSTVIVAHRDTEIFNTTPDMGHTHKVLCTLPDDLPFEKLLIEATKLYREFPPESISNDVREFDHKRRCKEQEWKANAEAKRRELERLRKLKVAIPSRRPIISCPRLTSYKTITVVTILAIGIYAFLKTGTGLN